jgi:hypothetical protein
MEQRTAQKDCGSERPGIGWRLVTNEVIHALQDGSTRSRQKVIIAGDVGNDFSQRGELEAPLQRRGMARATSVVIDAVKEKLHGRFQLFHSLLQRNDTEGNELFNNVRKISQVPPRQRTIATLSRKSVTATATDGHP